MQPSGRRGLPIGFLLTAIQQFFPQLNKANLRELQIFDLAGFLTLLLRMVAFIAFCIFLLAG